MTVLFAEETETETETDLRPKGPWLVALEGVWPCKKHNPPFSSPIPIVLHLIRSCKKQNLDKKNKQQFKDEVILLTKIRLKENEGTQRTLVRVREFDNLTVSMWVTNANSPLGNSTLVWRTDKIVVNKVIEWIIWSVAPVSMTQVLPEKAFPLTSLEEKTLWVFIGLPDRLEVEESQ